MCLFVLNSLFVCVFVCLLFVVCMFVYLLFVCLFVFLFLFSLFLCFNFYFLLLRVRPRRMAYLDKPRIRPSREHVTSVSLTPLNFH